jgi:general secretion pathway protein E
MTRLVTPPMQAPSEEPAGPFSEAASFEERLLQKLAHSGALSDESAERGRRAYSRAGGSLVDILVRLGLCEEKALAQAVAELSGCKLVGIEDFPETPLQSKNLSVAFLREARVLPLSEIENLVVVATADPANGFSRQALMLAFHKPVQFVVVTASLIEDGIARLYAAAPEGGTTGGMFSAAGDITDMDVARLRESASEAPIVRFVERLIARAVDAGASDIHIEPLERRLRVRVRVDGMLADEEPAPLSSAPAIVSRVKILAKLDIAERRLPQDGSIKLNVRGREIDFRVATTPCVHGESLVIRILDSHAVALELEELGFQPELLTKLVRILERPNGIFLVTGPTGSGKSTTLYAALKRLNEPKRKIITVEDPVEYKIDGLNQIQVKPDIGLDFARSLRSILRHDPDVIMVGEIRDIETARIATQAALTGHLVLSTLHTNDAASAVTRLLEMGIDDYLVASTVAGVLAQRLVRRLCADCRKVQTDLAALPAALISKRKMAKLPLKAYQAVGCPKCRGTGYRGRTVIAELMPMSERLRRAMLDRSQANELRSIAVETGMKTLYEDGLDAIFSGTTSHEEVLRVAQDVSG